MAVWGKANTTRMTASFYANALTGRARPPLHSAMHSEGRWASVRLLQVTLGLTQIVAINFPATCFNLSLATTTAAPCPLIQITYSINDYEVWLKFNKMSWIYLNCSVLHVRSPILLTQILMRAKRRRPSLLLIVCGGLCLFFSHVTDVAEDVDS